MTTLTPSVIVTPLAGSLGAEIGAVNLSSPVDDDTFAEIHAAFLRYQVLVFRDQDIAPDDHLSFARRFGEVLPHPYIPSIEGHPGIMLVYGPTPVTQTWHADFTYAEKPSWIAILVARTLPPVGGDTMFANMYAGYDSLSPVMQQMLSGLRAVHKGTPALAQAQGLSEADIQWTHPVIATHPVTGRRIVFVNADYTKHFEGMTVEESRPLLKFLYAQITRPEFTYRHRWRPGDVLMWDNRAVQHAVIGDVGGAERALHRVTVAGGVIQ